MIVLDTNVVSEVVKPSPSPAVITWLNQQDGAELFVTTITIGELCFGLEMLPDGKRKSALSAAIQRFLAQAFSGRVLPYDAESAQTYGVLMASRRTSGRPIAAPDGQIAAVARRHQFELATRNTKDFEGCGIGLINPFERVN